MLHSKPMSAIWIGLVLALMVEPVAGLEGVRISLCSETPELCARCGVDFTYEVRLDRREIKLGEVLGVTLRIANLTRRPLYCPRLGNDQQGDLGIFDAKHALLSQSGRLRIADRIVTPDDYVLVPPGDVREWRIGVRIGDHQGESDPADRGFPATAGERYVLRSRIINDTVLVGSHRYLTIADSDCASTAEVAVVAGNQ